MNAEEIRRMRDELYIAEIRWARELTPEARVTEGFRMFGQECQIARVALRDAYPQANDIRIEELFHAAIEKARRIERSGIPDNLIP